MDGRARLVDGSGTIIDPGSNSSFYTASGNGELSFPMQGLYHLDASGSATFKIQIAQNTGTNSITQGFVSTSPAIQWVITEASDASNATILVGSVTSSGLSAYHTEYAVVGGSDESTVCSGTCTILRSSGNWLTSVTRNSTGDYSLNFATGEFSAAPVCSFIDTNASSGGFPRVKGVPSKSTYEIEWNIVQATPSAVDVVQEIQCMGPR